MIVVRIELWPGGSSIRKKHLGTAIIANDATGNAYLGNYRVWFSKRGDDKLDFRSRAWRKGEVIGFPRRRLGAWDLLYRALHAVVADRNRPKES